MKKTIASEEKVLAASQEIVAEGGKLTVRAVRAKLGGGSLTTIHPLLQKIKAYFESLEKAGEWDLSPTIKKAIFQDRQTAIEEATCALRRRKEDLQAQAEEAYEELEQAEAQIEELRNQIISEQDEHDKAYRAMEQELAGARERVAALESFLSQKESELKETIRDQERLRARVSQQENEVKQVQNSVQEAHHRAETLSSRLQMALADCAQANERAAVAERHAKASLAACREAKQQSKDLREDLRRLQQENSALTLRCLESQGP